MSATNIHVFLLQGAEVTGDDIRHTLRDVAGLGIIFRMSAAVGEPGFIVDGFHTGCSAEVQRKVRIGMRLIAVNGIDVQVRLPHLCYYLTFSFIDSRPFVPYQSLCRFQPCLEALRSSPSAALVYTQSMASSAPSAPPPRN
eukprot:592995-Rhodomonas_salina.1